MKFVYKINSAREMKNLGKSLAGFVCENRKKTNMKAFVIALNGELGAGKTQFIKGLAQGLGIKQPISSPTFVICKSYKIPGAKKNLCPGFDNFYHLDCYRLRSAAEAGTINLKEIIASARNLVVIEWPQAISGMLPVNTLWLDFETISKNSRQVVIPAAGFNRYRQNEFDKQ